MKQRAFSVFTVPGLSHSAFRLKPFPVFSCSHFQCFWVCCDSSFPGSLFSFSYLSLVSFTDSCSDKVPAQWNPGLAVMLCTVHTQRKPTRSISTEAMADCMYVLDGVPVISASYFRGILGVSNSCLQCKVAATAFSEKSCSPLITVHCNFYRLP